jgi:hypothetical protein
MTFPHDTYVSGNDKIGTLYGFEYLTNIDEVVYKPREGNCFPNRIWVRGLKV